MADAIQLIGHGEHDMKMLYIQGIAHAVFGPKHLPGYLTFGAMAIATTIITVTFVRTAIIIALVFMSAKFCRSALLQGIEHRKLIIIGMVLHTIISPVTFNHAGYLNIRTFHYLCG